MKLKYLKVCAALAVVTSAGSAFASDGTITVVGEVVDTTCSIQVDNATRDATVVLPTVASAQLASTGETAGATPFNIALSGCTGDTLQNAKAYFEPGASVNMETGRLKLEVGTGKATELEVEILNSDYSPIHAGAAADNQNDVPVDISSGNGVLNYAARYFATGRATPGAVQTRVEYTVTYD